MPNKQTEQIKLDLQILEQAHAILCREFNRGLERRIVNLLAELISKLFKKY